MAAPPLTGERAELAGRLAGAAAVGSGAAVAVQQHLNGRLEQALGEPLLTALVSFGTGLLCVAAVVVARPAERRACAAVRDVPVWQRLGGLGGAGLIAVGAAAAPVIGVALLTVGLVAGQTAGGLLVDRAGLGPGGRQAVTGPRAAGAALCLLAVGVSVPGRGVREAAPLLLALVVAAGFGIAVQQALNGRVRVTTGSAAVATLLNFLVATTVLVVALALHAAVADYAVEAWPGAGSWWLYTGGPIGAASVAVATVVVRALGVLRLGLAVIAGQLVGAVLLDVGLPAPGTRLSPYTVAGAALTLVAVGVSGRQAGAVPSRRTG